MSSPPWPPNYAPPIKSVMTPFPYSAAPGDSLGHAARMMAEHDIRHLPVREGDALTGVVSERDLRRPRLATPDTEGGDGRTVGEVMAHPAFVVDLETPLDRVLAEMAERHIGCALVVRRLKLVGIFTTVDACSLFARQLGHPTPSDDDVA